VKEASTWESRFARWRNAHVPGKGEITVPDEDLCLGIDRAGDSLSRLPLPMMAWLRGWSSLLLMERVEARA
jgi:hypothetical protein